MVHNECYSYLLMKICSQISLQLAHTDDFMELVHLVDLFYFSPFYKGDNFHDFLIEFLHTKPLL